jgi:hypothetical protein
MTDKERRDAAVDRFALAMKARLDWASEVKGHTGWDGEYPTAALRGEIADDADAMARVGHEDKAVDIANRCMMLWHRANKE